MVKKVFFLLFLVLFPLTIYAQDFNIPLPQDAEKESLRDMSMGPMKMEITCYRTNLNKNSLIAFFKKEMPKAGWQQVNPFAFKKDNYMFSITFPPSYLKDKRQRFMVAYTVLPDEQQLTSTRKDNPDYLKFMPVYPRAKQAFLWDSSRGMTASYQSSDQIKDVVLFYKSTMPNYGWVLSEETPISKKVIKVNPNKDVGSEYQKEIEKAMKGMKEIRGIKESSFYLARLSFQKNKETCVINFQSLDIRDPKKIKADGSESPDTEEQLKGTRILVTYIEKLPEGLKKIGRPEK